MIDRKLQVLVCGLALTMATLSSEAQKSVPDAPAPVPDLLTHVTGPQISGGALEEKPARVADTKFIAVTALLMGLTISDIERTQHCLARASCVEMNPMLPHSRAGMYAVNLPINAGAMYLAYRMKSTGRKSWWIVPALNIAGHAIGTGIRF